MVKLVSRNYVSIRESHWKANKYFKSCAALLLSIYLLQCSLVFKVLNVSRKNADEITGWSNVPEVGAAVKFHPGVVGKWADSKHFKSLNRI
jgi:hypothetical protein